MGKPRGGCKSHIIRKNKIITAVIRKVPVARGSGDGEKDRSDLQDEN